MKKQVDNEWYKTVDRVIVGITSIVCAACLILIALLGPLMLNTITYKTSVSNYYLITGTDLSNLLFLMPLCLIGGILLLLNKPSAKYFLILSSLTLIYTGLSYGIGQEWNHPDLTGEYNVASFFWVFVTFIVGGLVTMIYSLHLFTPEDTPVYNRKKITVVAVFMLIFVAFFALMWIRDVLSNQRTPLAVLFWRESGQRKRKSAMRYRY